MRILALNTYHGGSHDAFLTQWQAHSRHSWTSLTLPAYHWKWRMRHAAVHFAEQLNSPDMHEHDLLWCTDMLNLAEFLGLAPEAIRRLPRVIYFHENQLGYPDRHATEKDLHYAFTNFTSALAASEVWFNSRWHMESFHRLTRQWLARMPDYQPVAAVDRILSKSRVQSPGIPQTRFEARRHETQRPLTLAWVGRWEADKNPELFFEALRRLRDRGLDFRLNVLGAGGSSETALFRRARETFSDHIDQWGYLEDANTYRSTLADCDLVVSTAEHEFFGIAILEAVASGCVPLVPDRLAYPETLSAFRTHHPECFYDGSADELVERLSDFAGGIRNRDFRAGYSAACSETLSRYQWPARAREMDERLQALQRTSMNGE